LTSVAQGMLSSAEYLSTNSGLSNSQFLTSLYQDELGRAPDSGGLASWNATLTSGVSRATVALDFAESAEAQQHLAANIEVGMKLL
jgi:hypothetical protein